MRVGYGAQHRAPPLLTASSVQPPQDGDGNRNFSSRCLGNLVVPNGERRGDLCSERQETIHVSKPWITHAYCARRTSTQRHSSAVAVNQAVFSGTQVDCRWVGSRGPKIRFYVPKLEQCTQRRTSRNSLPFHHFGIAQKPLSKIAFVRSASALAFARRNDSVLREFRSVSTINRSKSPVTASEIWIGFPAAFMAQIRIPPQSSRRPS